MVVVESLKGADRHVERAALPERNVAALKDALDLHERSRVADALKRRLLGRAENPNEAKGEARGRSPRRGEDLRVREELRPFR